MRTFVLGTALACAVAACTFAIPPPAVASPAPGVSNVEMSGPKFAIPIGMTASDVVIVAQPVAMSVDPPTLGEESSGDRISGIIVGNGSKMAANAVNRDGGAAYAAESVGG